MVGEVAQRIKDLSDLGKVRLRYIFRYWVEIIGLAHLQPLSRRAGNQVFMEKRWTLSYKQKYLLYNCTFSDNATLLGILLLKLAKISRGRAPVPRLLVSRGVPHAIEIGLGSLELSFRNTLLPYYY